MARAATLSPFEGHPLTNIEGFVVIVNENSTNGAAAEQHAQTLQAYEPERKVEVVHTDTNEEANRHRLLTKLHAGGVLNKLIIVGGGDGSVHYTVRALMHRDMDNEPDYIMTSWPLGYANDYFFATQDGALAGYPLGMLYHPNAHIFDGYPLEVKNGDGDSIDYATLYWTAGPTAAAAARFTSQQHRDRKARLPGWLRKPADVAAATPAMWLPDRHHLAIDGEPAWLTELQVTNADRMAIVMRYPSRLSEPEMYVSETVRNDPAALGRMALRMRLGRTQGTKQATPLRITVLGDQLVPIQSDGDPGILLPGETVSIAPVSYPIPMWATKADV